MRKGHNRNGNVAGDELLSLIQRVEKLEEEKAEIAEFIKEVFAEAKGRGFDPKTMKDIIKLRKMGEAEREEYEALIDIYKAALGMLNGTPLGEAAIRRLEKKPEPNDDQQGEESQAAEDNRSAAEEEQSPSLEEAREMARKAAEEGKPVTSNPFPARDARRAAWDEEWCKAAGSDGMELPDAWRRGGKKPSGKGGEGAEAA